MIRILDHPLLFRPKKGKYFQKVPGLNEIIIVTINAIWMNFGYVRLITFFINKTFVGQTVFEETDIWFMK